MHLLYFIPLWLYQHSLWIDVIHISIFFRVVFRTLVQSYVFPGVRNVICKDMGTIYRAKLQQESTKRESYSYSLYCILCAHLNMVDWSVPCGIIIACIMKPTRVATGPRECNLFLAKPRWLLGTCIKVNCRYSIFMYWNFEYYLVLGRCMTATIQFIYSLYTISDTYIFALSEVY